MNLTVLFLLGRVNGLGLNSALERCLRKSEEGVGGDTISSNQGSTKSLSGEGGSLELGLGQLELQPTPFNITGTLP